MSWTGKTHFSRTAGSGEEYVSSAYRFGEPLGNVFYVYSGTGVDTSPAYGFSPETPLATLAYALSLCVANNNDYIVLLPGHAENIASAGAITAATAGVTIVGTGTGADRATFTWSSTAGTFVVSADGVTIANIVTKVSVDEVVSMFSVTGAHVTFDKVDFEETASVQALQFVTVSAAGDRFTLKNCFHTQVNAAASAQKWIALVGCDHARILDNTFYIVAFASTASQLIAGTTAVAYCEIARNTILWIGGTITTIINLVTTSTGFIHDNRAGSGTAVATAAAFTCDACFFAENFWADTAAASGLLAPVVDTDS